MVEEHDWQPKNREERRALKHKRKQLEAIVSNIERDKKLGLQSYASKGFGTMTGSKSDILRNRSY